MGLTYYIKTFGCQMNVADSREYRLAMEAYGLEPASEPFTADLLIVNTCSVRAKAEDKLVSFLGAAQSAQAQKPNLKVGLVGCTATLIGEELKKRFPIIEFILPATDVEGFDDALQELLPDLSQEDTGFQPAVDKKDKFERFITVMRGCESFCAYCVVPYARGNVRSLPPGEILRRCDDAVDAGCRVFTLLGQNVMAYGRNPIDESGTPGSFLELLRLVSDKYPDRWIKFITSHPSDVNHELIDYIATRENITRHFHLPIQSGDDRVLKEMNRGYTSTDYKRLIEYIRERLPESRISTDMLVGFPTEDETAFANTLALTEGIEFDQMFTFQYSPRKGTAAYKWEDPVPFKEKRRRLAQLIELQNKIARSKHAALVGKRMPALIQGHSDKERGYFSSTTRESHIILLPEADVEPGSIAEVEITEGLQRTLKGILVG